MTQTSRRNCKIVCILAWTVILGLSRKLYEYQVANHQYYLDQAEQRYQRTRTRAPMRGAIFTGTGTPLALSVREYMVCADPQDVSRPLACASLLSRTLKIPGPDLLRRLRRKVNVNGKRNHYVVLAKHPSHDEVDAIRALMDEQQENEDSSPLAGVFLQPVMRRRYPQHDRAAQLVGFVDVDNDGVCGVERAADEDLKGAPSLGVAVVDARGRPVPPGFQPTVRGRAGRNVYLTIDDRVQAAAEAAVRQILEQRQPNFACAVAMVPATGEILAMATCPTFDLNRIPAGLKARALNRVVANPYEPGSTFKPIVAAVIIETGAYAPDKKVECAGWRDVDGVIRHCWILGAKGHGHGMMTLSDSIAESCNLGMIQFAEAIEAHTLHDGLQAFGFGQRLTCGAGNEKRGALARVSDWDGQTRHSIAFGQSILVTPLQLTTAIAALANGGVMMQPTVIAAVEDPETGRIAPAVPKVLRRVVSASTAATVLGMMERVVKEGTGQRAAIPDCRVAGKTGTAQKVNPATGKYYKDRFTYSFVGVAPLPHPQAVVMVLVDEPASGHWAGEICGPAFQTIVRACLSRSALNPVLAAHRGKSSGPAALAPVSEPLRPLFISGPVADSAPTS